MLLRTVRSAGIISDSDVHGFQIFHAEHCDVIKLRGLSHESINISFYGREKFRRFFIGIFYKDI